MLAINSVGAKNIYIDSTIYKLNNVRVGRINRIAGICVFVSVPNVAGADTFLGDWIKWDWHHHKQSLHKAHIPIGLIILCVFVFNWW